MMLLSRNGNSLPGFVAVAVAHCFLLYLVLQDHSRGKPVTAARYSRLLFIAVPRKPMVAETPPRQTSPAGKNRVAPSSSAMKHLPAPDIMAAPIPIENTAPADHTDPFEPPARLDIDNLVRQAGKADRETRSAREMQGYDPTRQSIEAIRPEHLPKQNLRYRSNGTRRHVSNCSAHRTTRRKSTR